MKEKGNMQDKERERGRISVRRKARCGNHLL